MAKSIPGQSSMFGPTISLDFDSATSLPASEDGRTPFVSPAGHSIENAGPDPVPANRGALRAKARVSTIHATFGRRGFHSSASADLAQSLASRLRARMADTGSTLFSLTWKESTTPSGRLIFLLRASVRHTGAHDYGSWPTPNTPNGGPSVDPSKLSITGVTDDGRKHTVTLEHAARFAAWTTPTAGDNDRGVESQRTRRTRTKSPGPMLTEMATWARPQARDHKGEPLKGPQDRGTKGPPLNEQARLAGSGSRVTGSHASTAKRGRLNPAHSRWLMGYPPAWDACAVTAMPSSRKSPPR